ncbi:ABC transporter permease [Leucobacter sp. CSA1]|uniref:ABC transporter permease n=1 Tax=Leucobacter chromiisoli TaxID=2796471 RepID=A0A934Q7C1_9MICO|nr:ABC transporter permease [Leucobacter chromiisoli]MBK0418411.1 ABC transporter permease [Leucobacter chromiisoli]
MSVRTSAGTGPAQHGLGAPARPGLTAARRFLTRRGPLLIFFVLLAYLAANSPAVLTTNNLWSSLTQAAPIAVVACGLAIVVIGGGGDAISGGIDLSIPGSAAMATLILSLQLQDPNASFWLAFLTALLAALAVGLVNAVLVSVVGLSPILATLATYVSVIGINRVLSQNKRINVSHESMLLVRDGKLLGIPAAVIVALVVVILLWLLLHRTRFGAHVQTVGGSRDAAVSAGLSVNRILASTYVLAAATAAVAAVLLVARGSGSSPGIDDRLLVDMVLATFVGAAFSARNVVTIPGAALGAVLVAFMSNGLILNRVQNSWVDGWKGALILLVVSAAALQNRDRK